MVKFASEFSDRRDPGVDVPMPMLPEASILNLSVYVDNESLSSPNVRDPNVDEAYMCFRSVPPDVSVIMNCGAVPAFATWSVLLGVEVPMPTLPLDCILTRSVSLLSAISVVLNVK